MVVSICVFLVVNNKRTDEQGKAVGYKIAGKTLDELGCSICGGFPRPRALCALVMNEVSLCLDLLLPSHFDHPSFDRGA